MNLNKTFILFVCIVIFTKPLKSQSGFLKTSGTNIVTPYGRVSQEELKMTQYLPDTLADAVVLMNNGFLGFTIDEKGRKYVLSYFKRIKLLKNTSFATYGMHTIICSEKEEIKNLKGQSISPDSIVTPVTDFYDEIGKGFKSKKIIFPNLKEGSIIEFQYNLESHDLFAIRPWYFQENIPVQHSELMFFISYYLDYMNIFSGRKPSFDIKRVAKTIEYEGKTIVDSTSFYRYYVDTLEAMKPESYITTLNNYLSNIKFQLKEVKPLWSDTTKIVQTWEAFADAFEKDNNLGKQLSEKKNYSAIWKKVKPLIENIKDNKEKISIIYDFINQNVNWNEDFSFYVEGKSLNDAFNKRIANSGELNLMLIACLNKAEIQAFPLLISTREHGLPYKQYPIVNQFNHVLCYVRLDDKAILLDAGNALRPLNLPRINSLNGWGMLLEAKNPRWIQITPPTVNEKMVVNASLKTEGMLECSISMTHDGYSALEERSDEKNENFIKNWKNAYPETSFQEINIQNQNVIDSFYQRNIQCTIPNMGNINNNLIYLKPVLNTTFDESPFKQKNRNYPVELPYPIHDIYELNLKIPKGFLLEYVPNDTLISLPDNAGSFQYSCKHKGDTLSLIMSVELKKIFFVTEEYQMIKKFFDAIVDKNKELLIFKKQ